MNIIVKPNSITYELLLTATSAISHHDPAVQDKSNRLLFNRQKQRLDLQSSDSEPASQELLDGICKAHPMQGDMAEMGKQLSFAEFAAVILIRLFLDIYNPRNNGEGEGLFSGKERYTMLEARFHQAAICAANLRNFWNRLVNAMQVSAHPAEYDRELMMLFALPKGLQLLVLRVMGEDYRSILAIARMWYQVRKENNVPNLFGGNSEPQVLHFDASEIHMDGSSRVVEVPAISNNSLRHQMVREPSWLHLFGRLGLMAAEPGKGPVPAGVEAIFYNGGNIAAGAKQPSNPFALSNTIRQMYPSLDLLGGVTDSFDIGESRLRVSAWLVCRENLAALQNSPAAYLPGANVSIFDLVDDETRTRMAGQVGQGQMIYNYESLAAGTQILVRFRLVPFCPILTRGALEAAISWYLNEDATLGGQAARGHGSVDGRWLIMPEDHGPAIDEYEAYIDENADKLRDGLITGTLGTGVKVLS
jgi:hypothetical protein